MLEQLGFRKIVDTSFMIAFMFPPGVDPADVEKYMNGMKRAQMDLDFEPEKYKHHYLKEIPERYRAKVDVRRFGPGERIVFLPYSEAVYAKTQAWLQERGLFEVKPPVNYSRLGGGVSHALACRRIRRRLVGAAPAPVAPWHEPVRTVRASIPARNRAPTSPTDGSGTAAPASSSRPPIDRSARSPPPNSASRSAGAGSRIRSAATACSGRA